MFASQHRRAQRRSARALLAAIEITAFSSLAHLWAGSSLPGAPVLAVLTAGTWLICLLVLRGALRIRTVIPLFVALQFLLHPAFAMLHVGGEAHATAEAGLVELLELNPPMLLAHLATAVVTAVILVVQRRAVESVNRSLDFVLEAVKAPIPLLRKAAPGNRRPCVRPRQARLLTSPRRGPPRVLSTTP